MVDLIEYHAIRTAPIWERDDGEGGDTRGGTPGRLTHPIEHDGCRKRTRACRLWGDARPFTCGVRRDFRNEGIKVVKRHYALERSAGNHMHPLLPNYLSDDNRTPIPDHLDDLLDDLPRSAILERYAWIDTKIS